MLNGMKKCALLLMVCMNFNQAQHIDYRAGNEMYGCLTIDGEKYMVDEMTKVIYKTNNGMGLIIWEEDGKIPFYDANNNSIEWKYVP